MSDVIEETKKVRVHFVSHPDDEWYDEMRVRCVERWKESELSGDEWRFSYVIEFMRKGVVLFRSGYSRWPWALAHVAADALNDYPAGASEDMQHADVIVNRYDYCFQPGCPQHATHEYRVVKVYSRSGREEYMNDDTDHRMRFCDGHTYRGDGALMVSDDNLVAVEFGSDPGAPALDKSR